MSATAKPSHPFAKDSADIILRAADGVDYRVHKLVLSEASSVFADMFTLPQPENPPSPPPARHTETDTSPALPVVDLTEPSTTVEPLLQLCYPMGDPVIELDAIRPIVHAARKYDMQWAIPRMGKLLTQHSILNDPGSALHAFAIACDLDLPEAEAAARASLREPLGADMPYALNDILPASLYRLLGYRARVRAGVVRYLMDPGGWSFTSGMGLTLESCDWGYGDTTEDRTGFYLTAEWCRMGHDHYGYDSPDSDGGGGRYVRIDDPYVVQELVKHTERLHDVFALHVPEEMIADTFRMLGRCSRCFSDGMERLRKVFDGLQEALRDVMLRVNGSAILIGSMLKSETGAA